MTTATTCPVCGRPVDPLRARAVGVKDGKVVAYDRAECQAKAEGKREVVVEDRDLDVRVTLRTPPRGLPAISAGPPSPADASTPSLESGPVIEVVREASAPAAAGDASAAGPTPGSVPRRDPTPVPVASRGDSTPVMKKPLVAKAPEASATATPAPARKDATPVARNKRLDTDTRHMQPPEDYDDSDLGPPSEAEPARRPPYALIIVFVALAAAAIAVAFSMK
jgi:hypothetical protein